MATGDQTDLQNRLAGLFPQSWFPSPAPVRDSVLAGVAFNLSWIYSLYAYDLNQTRLATATGVWLDRIAWDFLGPNLPRRYTTSPTGQVTYETDAAYQARIKAAVLQPRATLAGITSAIEMLTGIAPEIVEPWNPMDTAAYGQAYYGIRGYNYGSMMLNNQIFVTAFRPTGEGIANIAGYGYGYYGASTTAYVDVTAMEGAITDDDIYATAAANVAAGIVCWMNIEANTLPPLFILGQSELGGPDVLSP